MREQAGAAVNAARERRIVRVAPKFWDTPNPVSAALAPFSGLFGALVGIRRAAYRHGFLVTCRLPVPVIVVGNITVGGTGKTPLVRWLVARLTEWGYRPGIVSRGYGGRSARWPRRVKSDGDPRELGDEPVLLAAQCNCPVAVGPNRPNAAKLLLEDGCDIVVSDDGLQHYALGRDMEIAVVDGRRRFGNGWLLPAGPLREPIGRLSSVDFVVCNGGDPQAEEIPMALRLGAAEDVRTRARTRDLESFRGAPVHAVAAIGDPDRFFDSLRSIGLDVVPHPFPDHHAFSPKDLVFESPAVVLMTEKDAVKCGSWCEDSVWCVPVEADLPGEFASAIAERLQHERL